MGWSSTLNPDEPENYLKTRPTNKNWNKHRKNLCAFFSWAFKQRLIDQNPCFYIDRMPVEAPKKKIPTQEEMAKIILAAGKDRPFILVLFYTLARVDEIFRLKWEDVNFTEQTIRLWTRKRKDGSWHFYTLPMNDDLRGILWEMWQKRGDGEYVFVNPETGTRYVDRHKLMW